MSILTLQFERAAIDVQTTCQRWNVVSKWHPIILITNRCTIIYKMFLQPAGKDCRSASLANHRIEIADSCESVDNCFRKWNEQEVNRVVEAFVVEYDLIHKKDVFLKVERPSLDAIHSLRASTNIASE